jgi:hypothetical protein
MNTVTLKRSSAKHKKFAAVFETKDGRTRTVNFGDDRYQDFTQHGDEDRQAAYLRRHKKDPTSAASAGELSRVILWSAPSLAAGIRNFEAKHHVKIRRA